MRRQLIECVPNFSEGRDLKKVLAIQESIEEVAGAFVLAAESDTDHNRSVITFAGEPRAVLEAAFRSVAKAAELIDLRKHSGVHPRIGAADVVPLVPMRNITIEECAKLAHELGDRIWRELGIPVYFYEAAARIPERKRLESVRRGGFEGLSETALTEEIRRPDAGGPGLHPSAGAVVVGARKYLLAFNITLATADVEIARGIAKKVRASSGGLPHVKAIGVLLASRGMAQVSMNLTDFETTPLHVAYLAVEAEAARHGVSIAGSEIIGLMPAAALGQAAGHFLRCENLKPASILEERLLGTLID